MEAESAPWRIWAFDYFDQASAPSVEAEGEGLLSGLELLWRLVLKEGILDDGRPTFTWFSLEAFDRSSVQAFRVEIPRDPLKNPELGRIRGWREEEELTPALAQAHLVRLDSGGVESVLENALAARSPLELIRSLGMGSDSPRF